MGRKLAAEFFGTFWLVFGGCGSAVLAAGYPVLGIGFAGVSLAVGLALTLIHLVSIPVTNTSVNPARSMALAFFAQTGALSQLWLFWVAPLIGGAVGALIWKHLLAPGESPGQIASES